jgi:phenylacetate-coenzyme A ligase PaaK-like adenylate-forming protein
VYIASAYPFGGKIKMKKTDQYYNKPIETMGLDELHNLQQKKLKKQLQYDYKNSKY